MKEKLKKLLGDNYDKCKRFIYRQIYKLICAARIKLTVYALKFFAKAYGEKGSEK